MLTEEEKDNKLYNDLVDNKNARYEVLRQLTKKILDNLNRVIFFEDIFKDFPIGNDLTLEFKSEEIRFHSDEPKNDFIITNHLNRLKNDGYIAVYPAWIIDQSTLKVALNKIAANPNSLKLGIKITEKGLEKLEDIHMPIEDAAKIKQPAGFMALRIAKESNEIANKSNIIACNSKTIALCAGICSIFFTGVGIIVSILIK